MTPPSLFDFNRQFEQLLELINKTPWTVLRIKAINRLYHLLENSLNKSQRVPFRLEINNLAKTVLNEVLDNCQTDLGFDPEHLIQFHQYIRNALDERELLNLEYLIIEQLFRFGAHSSLSDFLSECSLALKVEQEGNPGAFVDIHSFQLEFLTKYGFAIPEDLRQRLNSHLGLKKSESSHSQVRGLFVADNGEQKCGILAILALENFHKFKKLGTDQLRIATHLVDENDILSDQGYDLFNWLRKKHPQKTSGHLRLEYTLSEKSSILSGTSLGFGLAVLADMLVFSRGGNKAFEPRIYTDVAITGAMDETGRVLAVNPTTVGHKLEAGFFSDIQTVVLPAQNKSEARQALINLNEKYPLRQLGLVFLSHIDELEKHREIFFYQRRRISRRIGQAFRTNMKLIILFSLFLVLMMGVGFWMGVINHSVPASLDRRGAEVFVLNKYGFTLWRGGGGSKHGVIADIINDESLEVILGYDKYTQSELNGYVVCYDKRGQIQWKFKTGAEVSYGKSTIEDQFNGAVTLVKDLNHDGTKEIVTSGIPGNFPLQICVLDNYGNKLSEYWHAGHLQEPRALDVYSDNGTDELIFCGINNEYRAGVVLVLDPFRMRGRSPAINSDYIKDGTESGNEIFYIKFPHTHFFIYPSYDRSNIVSSTQNGSIRVKHSFYVTMPNELVVDAPVFYVFDTSLRLLSASPGDTYYLAYQEYFTDREPLPYGDDKLIQYFSNIHYWNGVAWDHNRSINPIYTSEISD